MGKLVALFLLRDGMGQFLKEKLEYINIYKIFKYYYKELPHGYLILLYSFQIKIIYYISKLSIVKS